MNRREGEVVSRIYVGNLPSTVDHREVEREFERFGKVVRCDLKKTISGAPFAFIEFEDPRDAQDAIKERDGYDFNGSRLRVEIPFNARVGNERGSYRGRGRGGPGGGMLRRDPPRKGRYVVQITGLPLSGSWQDIKDHMREAGECGHADVFHDGTGEISFFTRRAAENAIKKFDGSIFRSHEGEKSRITVSEKDFGYDRDGERDRSGGRYRSRSRSRSYNRRDYDRPRERRRNSSYNSDDRDRSDKYEKRYSSSSSSISSRSRSNSNRSHRKNSSYSKEKDRGRGHSNYDESDDRSNNYHRGHHHERRRYSSSTSRSKVVSSRSRSRSDDRDGR